MGYRDSLRILYFFANASPVKLSQSRPRKLLDQLLNAMLNHIKLGVKTVFERDMNAATFLLLPFIRFDTNLIQFD